MINPRIIIDKILKYSCLEIDGQKLRITGKSLNQLTGNVDCQLVLGLDSESYFKKIFKVASRKDYKINSFDKISCEKNIEVYKLLLDKHKSNAFMNRPAAQISTLENGLEKFCNLSLEEQCKALTEIVKLFICKSLTCDLSLIGGSSSAGSVKFSKIISNAKSAILYNQSVTGLFEQKIDLLKL